MEKSRILPVTVSMYQQKQASEIMVHLISLAESGAELFWML